MAGDDETGYTTSEEQGDKGDASPGPSQGSKAFTTPSSGRPDSSSAKAGGGGCVFQAPTEAPAPAKLVSTLVQTQDSAASPGLGVDQDMQCVAETGVDKGVQCVPIAGVDKGMQCVVRAGVDKGMQCVPQAGVDKGIQCAPHAGIDKGMQCSRPPRTLMVSRAAQCGVAASRLASKGVQCAVQMPARGVSRGNQCRLETTETASSAVQCTLLVANEGLDELSPAQPPSGAPCTMRGARQSSPRSSREDREQRNRSDGEPEVHEGALPQPQGPCDGVPAVPPEALFESPEPAHANGGVAHPKSKRKRKKNKAAGGAARSAAVADAAARSTLGCRLPMVCWGDIRVSRFRKVWFFCGVVGLVMAMVWVRSDFGRVARSTPDMSGRGRAPLAAFASRGENEEIIQPPMWVMVGGSLTLGDVVASQRTTRLDDGAGFQWVKDGHVIPEQTRCVNLKCHTTSA